MDAQIRTLNIQKANIENELNRFRPDWREVASNKKRKAEEMEESSFDEVMELLEKDLKIDSSEESSKKLIKRRRKKILLRI